MNTKLVPCVILTALAGFTLTFSLAASEPGSDKLAIEAKDYVREAVNPHIDEKREHSILCMVGDKPGEAFHVVEVLNPRIAIIADDLDTIRIKQSPADRLNKKYDNVEWIGWTKITATAIRVVRINYGNTIPVVREKVPSDWGASSVKPRILGTFRLTKESGKWRMEQTLELISKDEVVSEFLCGKSPEQEPEIDSNAMERDALAAFEQVIQARTSETISVLQTNGKESTTLEFHSPTTAASYIGSPIVERLNGYQCRVKISIKHDAERIVPIAGSGNPLLKSVTHSGIGIYTAPNDNGLEIKGLIPGGPAEKSGSLKIGDKIVSVAEGGPPWVWVKIETKKNMPLSSPAFKNGVYMMQGKAGSTVKLRVLPAGASDLSLIKEIDFVRGTYELMEDTTGGRVKISPNPNNGKWTPGSETVFVGVKTKSGWVFSSPALQFLENRAGDWVDRFLLKPKAN